jgi:hypothetical protein
MLLFTESCDFPQGGIPSQSHFFIISIVSYCLHCACLGICAHLSSFSFLNVNLSRYPHIVHVTEVHYFTFTSTILVLIKYLATCCTLGEYTVVICILHTQLSYLLYPSTGARNLDSLLQVMSPEHNLKIEF